MDAVPFPKWQQYAITTTPIAPKCVFLGARTCHKAFGESLFLRDSPHHPRKVATSNLTAIRK